MTIAYDTEVVFFGTGNPLTSSYVPVGTVKGVVVMLLYDSASDLITSVTYGGVAVPLLRSNVDSNFPMRTQIFFLGSGIPAGTQTVTVNRTGAQTIIGFAHGLTAAGDTEVVDHDGLNEDSLTPQVTLQYASRVCQALAILAHADGTVAHITSLTGQTRIADNTLGAWSIFWDRQTTPGSSDFTIGYDATATSSADSAFSAVAVSEVSGGAVVGALDKTLGTLIAAGVGVVPVKGLSAKTLGAMIVAATGVVASGGIGSAAITLGALTVVSEGLVAAGTGGSGVGMLLGANRMLGDY